MKETQRRILTVMSSLYAKIHGSAVKLGKGETVRVRGEALLRPPTPLSTSRLLEKDIKTT
jgi:hypothetical protein